MRYYSDITNKFYDKEEELNKAEETALAEKKKISSDKKILSKEIEEAEKALDVAYSNYENAKIEAQKVLKEAEQKAKCILDAARDSIVLSKNKHKEAIQKFTNKYGVYTTTYTGKRAEEEYLKTLKRFDDIFRNFWLF